MNSLVMTNQLHLHYITISLGMSEILTTALADLASRHSSHIWANQLRKFFARFPDLIDFGTVAVHPDYLQLKVTKLDLVYHHLINSSLTHSGRQQTELK